MSTKAWHFAPTADALRGGIPWAMGATERHDGPLVLCESGLHASVDPLCALRYADGPWVRHVECNGEIVHDEDKFVCRERTPIWGYDATEVLRAFARRCALDVIHLWDAPEIVVRYLRTGDESIRAAAGAAAWDAAWAAAWAAARDAARSAARDHQSRRLARMLTEGRPR